MTYHDNDVQFLVGSGYSLISGSYTVESYSVSDGQDPDGHIHNGLVVTCGSDGTFTFSVGRHGTDQVADWFNSKVPSSQNTFNHGAGKLNFAFLGTLKLTITGGILGGAQETYTFSDVALAQGHSGASNNWWFGGQHSSYIGNNQVTTKGVNDKGGAVAFNFLRGDNGVNNVNVTPTMFFDTANWMGGLEDSTQLDGIMMPGSHDAGMSELHHCAPPIVGDGYTQTQSGSIGQQLVDGSRYFDIRVDYDYNQLVTYHRTDGWGCNGQSLVSVLDQAKAFLEAHPTETAILKFSHIRDYDGHDPADTKAKINTLLDNYSDVMYTNSNTSVNLAKSPLSDVRGKLILVFDYSDYIDPATGRFRYHDGSSPQPNLTVVDQYSDTSDYNTMKEGQLGKWSVHGGLGQGFFFLLSWTLTASPPGSTIRTLAGIANGHLPDVLYDQIVTNHASKPNVVYIDFVDGTVTQTIIRHNFQ